METDFKKKVKAGTVGWKSPYKHPEDFYWKGPKGLVLQSDPHSEKDVATGQWKSFSNMKRVMNDGTKVPFSNADLNKWLSPKATEEGEGSLLLPLIIGFLVLGLLVAGFCYWRKKRNAS